MLKPAESYTHTHTHTCSVLLSIFLIFDLNVAVADTDGLSAQVQYKEQLLQELKEEIQQINSEMLRCEKAKKGWVAATVVGAVGVAATGTAAIVQVEKTKKQKTDTTKNPEPKTENKK